MDPLSITVGCVSLITAITRTGVQIGQFVRNVREARSDLDALSRELLSLNTALELLAHDTKDSMETRLPANLETQVLGILSNCSDVVKQLEETLKKYERDRLRTSFKWTLVGKDDMAKHRTILAAHTSALDIASGFVILSIARDIKLDTTVIRQDTAEIRQDTTQILEEIAKLQARLPQETTEGSFMLQKYLDNMTTYAETGYAGSIRDADSDCASVAIVPVIESGSDAGSGSESSYRNILRRGHQSTQQDQELEAAQVEPRFSPISNSQIVSESITVVMPPRHHSSEPPTGPGEDQAETDLSTTTTPPQSRTESLSRPVIQQYVEGVHYKRSTEDKQAFDILQNLQGQKIEAKVTQYMSAQVYHPGNYEALQEYQHAWVKDFVLKGGDPNASFHLITGGWAQEKTATVPFNIALSTKDAKFFDMLMSVGVELNPVNSREQPIEVALQWDLVHVQKILDAGAAVESRHELLAYVAARLYPDADACELTKFLRLQKGLDLKLCPAALLAAASTGKEELVKMLLRLGADPNHVATEDDFIDFGPGDAMLALHRAIMSGHVKNVNALMNYGADPHKRIELCYYTKSMSKLRSIITGSNRVRKVVSSIELVKDLDPHFYRRHGQLKKEFLQALSAYS